MKSVNARPYRSADLTRLACGEWMSGEAEHAQPLAETLKGVDDMTVVALSRDVAVDVDGIRHDCGLPRSAPLGLVASWSSSGTYVKRTFCQRAFPESGATVSLSLAGLVPLSDVASAMTLETKVVLLKAPEAAEPLAPHVAGSILWSDEREVSLDEADSFFPMQVSDFGASISWAEPNSGWHLLWSSPDLERPFLGNVNLLINESRKSVVRSLSGVSGGVNSRSFAIRQAVYFDVARELILRGLRQTDFLERDGEYAEGTCGHVLNELIRTTFDGVTLESLCGLADSPELFSSTLQAKLAVFGDE